MKRTLLGVVAAALLVLTLPVAAVAQTRVHIDPANDVSGSDEGFFHAHPGSGPDIRKVVLTHARHQIRATVTFAPVVEPVPLGWGAALPDWARFFVTTGRHRIFEVSAFSDGRTYVERHLRDLRHHATNVRCPGARIAWHESARTVTLTLPRACAQHPRYVQLAADMEGFANSDPASQLTPASLSDDPYASSYSEDANWPKIQTHSKWTKRG